MALEILPYGRTAEDEAKRLAKLAASKRRGQVGCFFWLIAFALVAVFCWGWSIGVNTSLGASGHSEAVKRSESNGKPL